MPDLFESEGVQVLRVAPSHAPVVPVHLMVMSRCAAWLCRINPMRRRIWWEGRPWCRASVRSGTCFRQSLEEAGH